MLRYGSETTGSGTFFKPQPQIFSCSGLFPRWSSWSKRRWAEQSCFLRRTRQENSHLLTVKGRPNWEDKTTGMNHRDVRAAECTLTLAGPGEQRGSSVQSRSSLACYFGVAQNHMIQGCPIFVCCLSTQDWQLAALSVNRERHEMNS